MNVARGVAGTVVVGRAARGVGRADREGVLLDLAAVLVVQMAVVQVIDVPLVHDGRVAAVGTVLVGVVFVMRRHVNLLQGVAAPGPFPARWRVPAR